MLKLIYSRTDNDITLRYDSSRRFWNKKLLLALLVSLFIHLIMMGVFSIQSLKPKREIILKPVAVSSEIKASFRGIAQMKVDDYGFMQTWPKLENTMHPLQLITNLNPPSEEEIDRFDKNSQPRYTFLSDDLSTVSEDIPPLEVYKTILPVQIEVSENLKEKLSLKPMNPRKVLVGQTESLPCEFLVELDPKKGQLYFYEMTQSTGYYKYDQYAKRLLKELQFKPNPKDGVSQGLVTLIIEAEKRDLSFK